MNRRAFFATLTAGLAAAADPERLLWTPGKKLISIPKPQRIEFDVAYGYLWHRIYEVGNIEYDEDGHPVTFHLVETMSPEEFDRRYPASSLRRRTPDPRNRSWRSPRYGA